MKTKLILALAAVAMFAAIPTASAASSVDEETCGYAEVVGGCITWVDTLGGFEGEWLPGGDVKCVQMNDTMRACWATHKRVEFNTCMFDDENELVCGITSALIPNNQVAPTPISQLDNPSCFPIQDEGFYCVTMTDTSEEVTLHANQTAAPAVSVPVPVFTG
jgi:hypothetical protein